MEAKQVIKAGSNYRDFFRDDIGGKGLYLLGLYEVAQESGSFMVPPFFIVPTYAKRSMLSDTNGTKVVYKGNEVRTAFDLLKKPLAVRSSSTLEDGVTASFAGMFETFLNQSDYDLAMVAANSIYDSVHRPSVEKYSQKMNVPFDPSMAIIFQEQVTNFYERGVIQLESDTARMEVVDSQGREYGREVEFSFLDGDFPEHWKPDYSKQRDFISEGDIYYTIQCARNAAKSLGLEGITQVEFLQPLSAPPSFVQIRQLPQVKSYSAQLDMNIPDAAPYVESEVCNGVVGELSLPAYVTTSQSSLKNILIETGQSFFMGVGVPDEQAELFEEKSALAHNRDFQKFRHLVMDERLHGEEAVLPQYANSWREGNSLFDNYILVCDKLDETYAAMAHVTTNKRAIITTTEAKKTSHAMTVARDLGIMCMGLNSNLLDFESFFHQIETGDLVHMKSDGKRAIAYIEKKREIDPYGKLGTK